MKKVIKIYLEVEDLNKLKGKAEAYGYKGRGNISRYIERVAREPIAFLDSNLRAVLEVLNLKPRTDLK